MDVLSRINLQLEDFKTKRANLVKELQADFPSLLLPVLSQSKRIESIGWEQYTPYFNDGDECVFGVNYDDLTINGINPYADNSAIEFVKEKLWDGNEMIENKNLDAFEFGLLTQIKKVLKEVPEDFYKDLFGDHVAVTLYKDGRIETEEYDHD